MWHSKQDIFKTSWRKHNTTNNSNPMSEDFVVSPWQHHGQSSGSCNTYGSHTNSRPYENHTQYASNTTTFRKQLHLLSWLSILRSCTYVLRSSSSHNFHIRIKSWTSLLLATPSDKVTFMHNFSQTKSFVLATMLYYMNYVPFVELSKCAATILYRLQ